MHGLVICVIAVFATWIGGATMRAWSYELEVHSALTEVTVEVFNRLFPEHAISAAERKTMMAGSRAEDESNSRLLLLSYNFC
jgi:hypothetical protein